VQFHIHEILLHDLLGNIEVSWKGEEEPQPAGGFHRQDPSVSLPALPPFKRGISFAVTFEAGTSARAASYSTVKGYWTPDREFPFSSRFRSHRPTCWKSWKDSCLNARSTPRTVSAPLEANYTISKNRSREKYPPLFPGKTSIIHKSQMDFFSLFI